jgi:primosomal protein N' (replication factor Y)
MYAQVVVPSYKGPNEDGFTYEVPAGLTLTPGQLMLVPFGRVREIGIVWEVREEIDSGQVRMTKNVTIKPIESVVFEKPFLLPYQLELLRWMAKYYLAGTGNCANAMLPALPTKISNSGLHPSMTQGVTLSQTLILVPTINNIPQTMALFPKALRPLVYHSELKPKEKLEAWQKVMNRNCDYIFGTRQAVFLPFPKLRKIIIINEHDDAYKDQRSPYYDTLTVAEKVAELTKAKIEVIDPAPRITTSLLLGINPALRTGMNPNNIKIVSMAEERKVGNKTAISDELKYQIEENMKNGGNTLLYLNKKKDSGTLYCNNCRYQEALPKEPEKCPSCSSKQIFFASLNINSLAKQIEKLFPRTKVNLISDNRPGLNPTIAQGLTLSIDIATSAVFYKLLPKHYGLVAAISIDSTLNVPEYTAPEKAYSLITTLKRLTSKTLVLQTYNPENPTLIAAANSNYLEFYYEQIEQRKTLLYPPFSVLVKLVVKGKNDEKTLTKAEKLAEDITNALLPTANYQLPTVLGPFESYFRKTSKTYNIVIKIPLKSYTLANREKAIESGTSALQSASAARVADQIVIDPTSLN